MNKPSCFLIGNTSLLIQCCDLLLNEKWVILGIISYDPVVTGYATRKNIPLIEQQSLKINFLKCSPFDYLFSIVNEVILGREVLELPRKLAINYHDSLLPEGAGVFSSTWALINRKEEHGITWHIIDEGIDTGDIFIQKKVAIENFESSISLNLKCYQAAIESFSELIKGLEYNSFTRLKQDSTKRTYYPLGKRPSNIGILDVSNDAFQLKSLLKALDFGENLDNKFCSAKILIGNQLFIPLEYSFEPDETAKHVGRIVETCSNKIVVRIGGNNVLSMKRLATIEGEEMELAELIEEFKLFPGTFLRIPDQYYLTQVGDLYEELIAKENYWVRKLSDLKLVEFPFVYKENTRNIVKTVSKYELNEETLHYCSQSNGWTTDYNLLSLLLMFVSRLLDNFEFDIWFKVNSDHSKFPELFAPCIPMGCRFDKKSTVAENLEQSNTGIKKTIAYGTFARDIFIRRKILKEEGTKSITKRIPFFIGQVDDPSQFVSSVEFDWGILISVKTGTLHLHCPPGDSNTLIAEMFFRHFSVFVQNTIYHPENALYEVALLDRPESKLKVFEWNRKKISFPENDCIHDLIRAWAIKTPCETAMVLKDKMLSYAGLDQQANLVAAFLLHNGITPGGKVGVMMNRSIEMVVSFVGILKVGAVYVPLDINLPSSRLAYMIEDAEIKMIVGDNGICGSLSLVKSALFSDIINAPDIQPGPFPKFHPDNLAYIKYTSGSTGQPKGVMITHRNVIGFLHSYRDVINVFERRVGTCVAPLSFDTSVEEIYSCLCFGGTVHIMMNDQTMDLNYFADYLIANRINVSYIVPEFIDGVGTCLKKHRTIYLKTLLTGLYAKKNKVFSSFFELNTPVLVLNGYGPTEVTYGSNAYEVKGTEDPLEYTPIGKPFPNYQTYIVDSEMQLVPDFIQGELLIGGIGLAKGYINKPEITGSKFVKFHFENFSNPVYRSGDIVYSLPSGDFQFLGRNDDQVKISGYRIEISEVEAALNGNENVLTTIITKRKGKTNHDQLIAYVVLKTDIDNAANQLHHYLREKLPGYMIPSFIIPIKTVPQFSNGKTNYSLLPEPNCYNNVSKTEFKQARNNTEEKVKQIFEEELGIDQLGVEDNFFDVGGDSITAVHIMQRIEHLFGRRIPIDMIYKFSSIRLLSAAISEKPVADPYNFLIPVRQEGSKDPVFFIHDFSGSVLIYRDIINKINPDYPIYCIRSNYLNDTNVMGNSIENISGSYIKSILSVSKSECIVLIGFSLGGIVAFEMARQLYRDGHKTCLIVLDSSMRDFYLKKYPGRSVIAFCYEIVRWLFPRIWETLFSVIKTKSFDSFRKGMSQISYEVAYFINEANNYLWRILLRRNIFNVNVTEPLVLNDSERINHWLMEKYSPEKYEGNLFLIQFNGETEGEPVNKTRTNCFRPFVSGKIFRKTIDSSHVGTFSQPHEIARLINTILQSKTEC